MKVFTAVVKILAALAAVAGAVYVIATYGDKIVAWAKNLMAKCPCNCSGEPAEEAPTEEPVPAEETKAPEEAPAEEAPAAEAEAPAEEAPATEAE